MRAAYPHWTSQQVKQALINAAVDIVRENGQSYRPIDQGAGMSCAYAFITLSALKVFHLLGSPICSMSKWTLPGVCAAGATCRRCVFSSRGQPARGHPIVVRNSGRLKIIQSPQNVVVPPRRIRKHQELRLNDLVSVVGEEQPVAEDELDACAPPAGWPLAGRSRCLFEERRCGHAHSPWCCGLLLHPSPVLKQPSNTDIVVHGRVGGT